MNMDMNTDAPADDTKARVQPITCTAQVTNQLPSLSTFALRDDTSEQIFISSNVAMRTGIREGDILECKIVPNVSGKCPWFAIFARKIDPTPANALLDAEAEPPLSDRIHDYLLDHGPATAKHMAGVLGLSVQEVWGTLRVMHRDDEIARGELWQRPGQKRCSFVVWAVHASDMLPEGEADDAGEE